MVKVKWYNSEQRTINWLLSISSNTAMLVTSPAFRSKPCQQLADGCGLTTTLPAMMKLVKYKSINKFSTTVTKALSQWKYVDFLFEKRSRLRITVQIHVLNLIKYWLFIYWRCTPCSKISSIAACPNILQLVRYEASLQTADATDEAS